MALIAAENLTKIYGTKNSAFTALDGIDFEVDEGESLAILGKSGSGKSTLMHLLALLDKPDSGTIRLDGNDVHKLSRARQNQLRNQTFGFVFQQFFLNANDTVLNNVILPLKIAGVGRKERLQRGMEALEEVDIPHKAKNRANDLSGGEKQRVCIARALINQPRIIFADEPTGNLDSQTGKRIEDLLFSLNQEKKITLIIVTHDIELAERCERQVHLKDGRIMLKESYV